VSVSGRYFIPGPVEVNSDVMQAMQRPMMAHRTAAASELVASLQPGLQSILGTARPVMLITGSATAMMEAAIRSGVRDSVLCIVSGLFGARFADIATRCGKGVTRLHVHPGEVLEPALLRQMLDGPAFDAVTMVHSETSTGALAPVAELLSIVRERPGVITIVDVVSSAGGMAIEADRWHADFVFTGSQKAIGLPPGLAFGVASEAFLERAAELDERGMYLDVVDLHRAAETSRFPQTPALPVVYALQRQLERIAAEGLTARFARHRVMREAIERWTTANGRCGILAPVGRRADTVTALTLPDGASAVAIARSLAQDGWQVATGIEPDHDRWLRIGHMGDVRPEQLDLLLQAIAAQL
jgi:aspartate aminotransferase-like enzyme